VRGCVGGRLTGAWSVACLQWHACSYTVVMAWPCPPPLPLPTLHHTTNPHPQEYAAYLRELMKRSIAHPTNPDAPLTGFKIVVDPGNGGGAFIADQVGTTQPYMRSMGITLKQLVQAAEPGGLVATAKCHAAWVLGGSDACLACIALPDAPTCLQLVCSLNMSDTCCSVPALAAAGAGPAGC